ncbi:unnamed protein product, partial [Mesorhabditis spiculigera]
MMRGINKIILLLAAASSALADYCPAQISSKIQECVQPVAEYAKVLNENQDSNRPGSDFPAMTQFSLPNMGGRVFNDLCKLVHKFNRCVQPLRADCPRHVTISLIDSSYGYLCNEGYSTFLESAECLMELDRQPSVKACHDETLQEIEVANTESGLAMNAKLDKMCSALNFFSDCVKSPIRQDCGSAAWAVIYRVLKDTTNTLMPGCQFTVSHHRRKGMEPKETTVYETVPTEATNIVISEGMRQAAEPLNTATSAKIFTLFLIPFLHLLF